MGRHFTLMLARSHGDFIRLEHRSSLFCQFPQLRFVLVAQRSIMVPGQPGSFRQIEKRGWDTRHHGWLRKVKR